MGEITKHAVIEAPAEQIFAYVSDPRNAPSFIESINQIVSGPEGPPVRGQVWRAEATLFGKRSTINLRLHELQAPRLVRFAIDGDPSAVLSLDLSPNGGRQTRVSLHLDVPKVPSLFLNGLMSGILEKDILRLKRTLEG